MSIRAILARLFGRRPALSGGVVVSGGWLSTSGSLSAQHIPTKGLPQHLLDHLCVAFAGTYERTTTDDGHVLLRFRGEDGDVIAAKGATTKIAIAALHAKLELRRRIEDERSEEPHP